MSLPASKFAVPGKLVELPVPPRPQLVKAERARALELKSKVDRASTVLDRLDARVEELKARVARLQKQIKCCEVRRDRIEDTIIERMLAANVQHVAGYKVTFTARPAVPSLEVLDESLIPDTWKRAKVSITVDKVGLKAAIARGLECAGVRLIQRISLLRK